MGQMRISIKTDVSNGKIFSPLLLTDQPKCSFFVLYQILFLNLFQDLYHYARNR